MDRLCATCRNPLKPDHGFCDNCGAAWVAQATSPATVSVSDAPAPASAPVAAGFAPAPTRKGRGGLLLMISLLVVLLLAAAGWFFVRTGRVVDSSVTSSVTTSASSTIAAASIPPTSVSATPAASDTATSATASTETVATETAATDTTSTETLSATAAATEAAAGSKACSLLTRAEMEKVLGAKIVRLTSSEQSCSYFTDDSNAAQVDTVWTGGKDAYAQVKGFNSAPGLAQPVAGIGDEAYLQAAGVLHVLKGDTYVVVNSRAYPKELEVESAIARKAMEKLLQ